MSHDAPPARRPRSRLRRRWTAAWLTLIAVAGYAAMQYVTSGVGPSRCTVRAKTSAAGPATGTYRLKPEQAANAATINAVAARRDLPERAVTIALATAMQESGLRNLDHGDRDSRGLFQQRPSQGWGDAQQIVDPVYSAQRFYDHLLRIPDYQAMSVADAAQSVQHSAFPRAYAKHQTDAELLTGALSGRDAASFSCTTGPGGDGEDVGTGSRTRVRALLEREFGKGALSGRTPQPSEPGHGNTDIAARGGVGGGAAGSARSAVHPASAVRVGGHGRELRLRAGGEARGWELAHWAVAHAADLHIRQVVYRDRVWDAGSSRVGWRLRGSDDAGAEGDMSAVTMVPRTGR